jgi:orotate phosphoribosyltransferase
MHRNDPRWQRLRERIRQHSWKEGDFVLASGARSSYYVDLRRTSLTSEGGVLIGELLLERIRAAYPTAVAAGGLTLGADPLTTSVAIAAWHAGIPWSSFLVRKEAKGHGAGRQVEFGGDLEEGAAVVVLDDTITTGGSTLQAVDALQREGYRVIGAACIVDRGEGGRERLLERGLQLETLYEVADLRSTQHETRG